MTSPPHSGNPHSARARLMRLAKGSSTARNAAGSWLSLSAKMMPLSWSVFSVCSKRPSEPSACLLFLLFCVGFFCFFCSLLFVVCWFLCVVLFWFCCLVVLFWFCLL